MSINDHADFVRQASAGCSDDVVAERLRFAEILQVHAASGAVDESSVVRLLNFACNPDAWEDWKSRGGDAEFFSGEGD